MFRAKGELHSLGVGGWGAQNATVSKLLIRDMEPKIFHVIVIFS